VRAIRTPLASIFSAAITAATGATAPMLMTLGGTAIDRRARLCQGVQAFVQSKAFSCA
jgi:hypothetical protein